MSRRSLYGHRHHTGGRGRENRLAKRIVAMLAEKGIEFPGGPENAYIRRTYAGHWQTSAGAWLWSLEQIDRVEGEPYFAIGSQDRAADIARYGFIVSGEAGSYHLDLPDDIKLGANHDR